jgi:hypothetical protein
MTPRTDGLLSPSDGRGWPLTSFTHTPMLSIVTSSTDGEHLVARRSGPGYPTPRSIDKVHACGQISDQFALLFGQWNAMPSLRVPARRHL